MRFVRFFVNFDKNGNFDCFFVMIVVLFLGFLKILIKRYL